MVQGFGDGGLLEELLGKSILGGKLERFADKALSFVDAAKLEIALC